MTEGPRMREASGRVWSASLGAAAVGIAAILAVFVVALTIGRPTPVAFCEHVATQDGGEIGLERSVFVSDASFASDEPYDIVSSNIAFVNTLKTEHFREEEIARDALRSYYVDYYLAQVQNGGFSQFVWNSKWSPVEIDLVREGLCAIKAVHHLALFNESAAFVDRMGPDRLRAYLQCDYWGTNPDRDALDAAHDDRFAELSKTEDLIALNAAWLRSLPGLQVKTSDEIRMEIERRVAALPDREERKRAALENEPRYVKLIRALVAKAGQELSRVTGGDPTHQHNGKRVIAWHFITDKGHHYMVDADGRAVMFEGATKKPVAEIVAP
jgi:hypothetical protein